ncbi:MAG TPA: hypothetical protein VFA56_00005, partial [Gaiellaceae bacterium]|nr:hypothetical protein [Gaiellaceae bacterium]
VAAPTRRRQRRHPQTHRDAPVDRATGAELAQLRQFAESGVRAETRRSTLTPGDQAALGSRGSGGGPNNADPTSNSPPAYTTPPGFVIPGTRMIAMAAGGTGRVLKPTLFLAGEAGPEDFAFSGGGRSFTDQPVTVNVPPAVVQVAFADGMGWLEQFVTVKVQQQAPRIARQIGQEASLRVRGQRR